MLHRSFKPAKCKTSLKLATSRLKLMKNKKLVQINQMKRELSQLLETGQERTARIRVEHVIREEKMVAAYELIEIYCELIAARLPIIESQKSCPIDMKEAVTSVIFASPRCSDITELQDVRKHFATKYGKEFISGAIELRPDCGVGRMLIEKLSAVAPDAQTKIKVLSAVAAEYNIKWDPKAFEEKESQPPDDLLNGPNTFEQASVHADPPKYQAAPIVQVPYSHEQGSNEPVNYSQQNSRSSVGTGNYASTDIGGIQSSSSAPLADARASGRGSERMEVGQSLPREDSDNSHDRQNWNMEFKDATAAAQAAAESAERASMAARAAVELSSQGMTGQPSTNSRKSNYREQEPQRYGASDFPPEHYSRGSYNNSFSDKKPKVQDQQIGRSENEEKSAERYNEDGYGRRSSQAASLKSRNDLIHDDNSVRTEQKTHGYSEESSFQAKIVKAEKSTTSSPKMSTREQTRRTSNVELDRHDSLKSDNYGYHEEEMNRNQSITSSSRSHAMNSGDDYNDPGFDRRRAEDRYIGVDHGNNYEETKKTSIHDYVADDIASDETESDEDGPRFDKGSQIDELDAESFFPTPVRESPTHSLEHTSTWSPKKTIDESVYKSGYEDNFSGRQIFSEQSGHSAKSVISSEPDNLVPAAFDPSDGPVFDDEDESDHEKMNEQIIDLDKREKSRIELTDLLEASPSPRSHMEEEKGLQPQQSSNVNLRDEFQDDAKSPQSSDSESGPGLNLGALPGGFRNKGYKRPPYTKNPSGNALSLSDKSPAPSPNVEPTPTPIIKSSINSRVSSPNVDPMPTPIIKSSISSRRSSPIVEPMPTPISSASKKEQKESGVSQTISDSDFNYSSFNPTQEETRKSRFDPPPRFFDHDDDDSEDDRPKGKSSSRVNLGTGTSRRTKAAPSTSVNSASVTGRKPSRHSYSDETSSEPLKPSTDPKISRRGESLKPQTAEQPSGGPSSAGTRTQTQAQLASSRQEAAKREKAESKSSKREESLKSQATEKPSSPLRKKVDSEIEKASSGGTSTGEKKASHVHPKLPDYDDIAARLQALRMNR